MTVLQAGQAKSVVPGLAFGKGWLHDEEEHFGVFQVRDIAVEKIGVLTAGILPALK